MELYKAVDKLGGMTSMFLVYDNGEVAVNFWGPYSNGEKERRVRVVQDVYIRSSAERFNDAIDPVLIAEW